VYIGAGLLEQLHTIGADIQPRGERVVIISPRVRSLHGPAVLASFPADTKVLEFEDGEEQKTLENVNGLLGRLIEARVQRDALVYVVGGGVVGDAAGFAASILLRGVSFIHVPTTLLSQVDSSIGGKLGVNHRAGKNLIGSFAAPRAVVSDVSVLRTLERRDLLSGMFEAMKSGVISDPELFELTEGSREVFSESVLQELVQRSVRVKAAIVSRDEKESGDRRLLNYGHTLGHAIETASHYRGVSHGEAVGWGMLAANAIAVGRRLLSRSDAERIDAAIRRHRPATLSHLTREAILEAAGHDKKFHGKRRVMVLPQSIGRCTVVEDISSEELELGAEVILDEMRRSETA
jgi:3-dehydroquinate synthase